MEKGKKPKRHFFIWFRIKNLRIEEKRYKWYVNRESFIKSIAREFEEKYPGVRIFIEVIDFFEINHPEKEKSGKKEV